MSGMEVKRDMNGRFVDGSAFKKYRTPELTKQIASKLTGQKRTPETCKKFSEIQKEYWHNITPEQDKERRKKISDTMRKKISNGWRVHRNNPCFKGGKYKDKSGYIHILIDKLQYKLEHRYVMEQYLNRELTRNESVHHINGIKDDNRIENLMIVINKMHFGDVDCPYCSKRFRVK